MKNLKLLNKKYLLLILFCLFFGFATQSQEAVDIWNIEEKETDEKVDIIKNIKKKILHKILFIRCNPKKQMGQI